MRGGVAGLAGLGRPQLGQEGQRGSGAERDLVAVEVGEVAEPVEGEVGAAEVVDQTVLDGVDAGPHPAPRQRLQLGQVAAPVGGGLAGEVGVHLVEPGVEHLPLVLAERLPERRVGESHDGAGPRDAGDARERPTELVIRFGVMNNAVAHLVGQIET